MAGLVIELDDVTSRDDLQDVGWHVHKILIDCAQLLAGPSLMPTGQAAPKAHSVLLWTWPRLWRTAAGTSESSTAGPSGPASWPGPRPACQARRHWHTDFVLIRKTWRSGPRPCPARTVARPPGEPVSQRSDRHHPHTSRHRCRTASQSCRHANRDQTDETGHFKPCNGLTNPAAVRSH